MSEDQQPPDFEVFLDRLSMASMVGTQADFDRIRLDYRQDPSLRQRVYDGLGQYLKSRADQSVLEDSTGVTRVASQLVNTFEAFNQAGLSEVVVGSLGNLSEDDRATISALLLEHIDEEQDPDEQENLANILGPYLE